MLSVEHAYSIGELTLSLCIILLIKALRLRISQIYSQDDISFVVLGSGKLWNIVTKKPGHSSNNLKANGIEAFHTNIHGKNVLILKICKPLKTSITLDRLKTVPMKQV